MDFLQPYLNATDISVLVILILGLLGGVRRGLSGELLRIATIVLAVLAGWKGAETGARWLAGMTDWSESELKPIAFFGLIVGTYLILAVVRFAFRLFLDFSFKGKLEILGGALLGLMRAAIFCGVVLLGASLVPYEPVVQTLAKSVSGTWAIQNLKPWYEQIAEKNPEFKLPELSKPETPAQGFDTPAWEDYLGPVEPEGE